MISHKESLTCAYNVDVVDLRSECPLSPVLVKSAGDLLQGLGRGPRAHKCIHAWLLVAETGSHFLPLGKCSGHLLPENLIFHPFERLLMGLFE